MVGGETAIESSNQEEVTGPYNPWRYLKANFSPATPPEVVASFRSNDRCCVFRNLASLDALNQMVVFRGSSFKIIVRVINEGAL